MDSQINRPAENAGGPRHRQGILFDDPFGVIAGVGRIMGQFGDAGLAGLLALIFLVAMYSKK